MTTLKEAYKRLGVDENSTMEEIKKKWKELNLKYHPDRHRDNPLSKFAEEELKKINEAYSIIEEHRKKYGSSNSNSKSNSSNYSSSNSKSNSSYNSSSNKNNNSENNRKRKDSLVFYWNEFEWEISPELQLYNHFRREVEIQLPNQIKKFSDEYNNCPKISDFLYSSDTLIEGIIDTTFDYLVTKGIELGHDMLSPSILEDRYFSRVVDGYNKMVEMFVKGSIYTEYGTNTRAGKEVLKKLKIGIEITAYECLRVILELLRIEIPLDIIFARSVLENISKYPINVRNKKLFQALVKNPYDIKIYRKMLHLFGDLDKELDKIANYFGQNIKEEKERIIQGLIIIFRRDLLNESKDEKEVISKFEENMYYLGAKVSDYLDIGEEVRKAHFYKINPYIEEFKNTSYINRVKAVEKLKRKAKDLKVILEEYIDIIKEIALIREKEIKKHIEDFRRKLGEDREKNKKLVEELREILKGYDAKLEDYIDIEKECKNVESAIKKAKNILMILLLGVVVIILWFTVGKNLLREKEESIPVAVATQTYSEPASTSNITPSNEIYEKEEKEEEERVYQNNVNSLDVSRKDSKTLEYDTYYNARYGFAVDYPREYFIFLPEAPAQDGRVIETRDGEARIIFSAIYNATESTLKEEFQDAQRGKNIAYKHLGKDFYVVSYKEYIDGQEKIIYKKVRYDEKFETYMTLYFEYTEKYANFMKPILEKMVKTMRTPTENGVEKQYSAVISPEIDFDELNRMDDLALLDEIYREVIIYENYEILEYFTKEKLGYIRNTIYARRGYIFKSEKYRKYFSKKSWYQGFTTNQNILPEDEERLANIIKEYEK